MPTVSGMTVCYGSFSFPVGEAEITFSQNTRYLENGDADRLISSVDISGKYEGTSYSGYESQMTAMIAAMASSENTFYVKYPDASIATHLTLSGSSSLVGPRATAFSFPESTGPEFAAVRTYRIRVEAEKSPAGTSTHGDVVSYKESVSISSGSGIYQVIETITGAAQIFLTCQKTAFRATQQGEAVGLTDYPAPSLPLWPDALIDTLPVTYDSPSFVKVGAGGTADTCQMFRTQWSYSFAGSVYFCGTDCYPHSWAS